MAPTSVRVVEVDKLLPLVVRKQAEDGTPEGGAHLDDKLHLIIGGVTGCDEGGVQSPAEGGQGVHGLLVIESEDGVHPTGELRANCGDRKGQKDVKRVLSKKIEHAFANERVITFNSENDFFDYAWLQLTKLLQYP